MMSKESSTSPVQPSEELERAASELEQACASDFTGYGIGRLLTYSAAFARLVEPHVPASVRGDAQWLRGQVESRLRETLAVCVLSVADVLGTDDSDDETPLVPRDPGQLEQMRASSFTREFSDILCDGGFWPIVDNIRGEIGLSPTGD